MTIRIGLSLRTLLMIVSLSFHSLQLLGQEVNTAEVRAAADRGVRYLIRRQLSDGSFPADGVLTHPVAVTSLATLALLDTGMSVDAPPLRRSLGYLRGVSPALNSTTHELASLLMAFIATNEPMDLSRTIELADRLQQHQLEAGGWTSLIGGSVMEPGLSQLAILALRDASRTGVRVDNSVWKKARQYWQQLQNADGSWGQVITGPKKKDQNLSVVSMTFGAMTSLSICQQMLTAERLTPANGELDCCQETEPDEQIRRGIRWLQNEAGKGTGKTAPDWSLIYGLSELERANRSSGQVFWGEFDWYHRGVSALLSRQDAKSGHWNGNNDVVSTCHALLFLSKALTPVLINKLKYGPRDPVQTLEVVSPDWNRHPGDVGNLVDLLRERKGWPRFMTSQEVDVSRKDRVSGLRLLRQAPVVFMTGTAAPELVDAEVALLKEYLQQGGFLFAAPACQTKDFEIGFRDLVKQIVSELDDPLLRLPADHPLFRSEVALDPDRVEFYGVETGCRTSIVYCPEDLACLWSAWTRDTPPNQGPELQQRIRRGADIGANVIAYATGREPPVRFDVKSIENFHKSDGSLDGRLLQIAQVRHGGAWNTASDALANLLKALHQSAGIAAAPQPATLSLDDPRIFRHPILYMHGRSEFSFSQNELEMLRQHLERGGIVFADACCGAASFDRSIRTLAEQLGSDTNLKRIPLDHELFSERIGYDLSRVQFRSYSTGAANSSTSTRVERVEPFLEGVEIDGRLVLIYSKYDLSCALDLRANSRCEGYSTEDAVRLATNIVRYALLQELRISIAP